MGSKGLHRRIVAAGCFHVPYVEKLSKANFLKIIRRERPTDVVVLGDLFEASAASVHPDEAEHDLATEYAHAAELLHEIRSAAPKGANLVWTLGNHDDNLQRRDARRVPKDLRRAVHWNTSQHADEFRRWRQLPYVHDGSACYQVGPVVMHHGFAVGRNSDHKESCVTNVLTGGWSHRLYVRAHTHAPLPPTQVEIGGVRMPWHCANVGTVGPLKPRYAERLDTTRWGRAAIVIACSDESPSHSRPGMWRAHLESL